MSGHFQIYYHIVYSVKYREPRLLETNRRRLFAYLYEILQRKRCHLYRMNGCEDHIHIFTSLHTKVDLAGLIREMKVNSTNWIKHENIFPNWPGWQVKYGAFTKSHSHKDQVIEYIKNQESHHRTESYSEEIKRLFEEEGLEFVEEYLE